MPSEGPVGDVINVAKAAKFHSSLALYRGHWNTQYPTWYIIRILVKMMLSTHGRRKGINKDLEVSVLFAKSFEFSRQFTFHI